VAQIRVGLAQVDPTVGDLSANADAVVRWTRDAHAAGCHLVAFPEMMLPGYPAEDLVLRRSFVEASVALVPALARRLADEGLGEIAVIVGYVDHAPDATPRVGRPAGEPQNACALLYRGDIVATYAKHHLPNYGVFDEFRYFVPGDRLPVVRLHGIDIAMCICEDLWQDGGPTHVAGTAEVDLIVCINGSPYERDKDAFRLSLVQRRAAEARAVLAYVNMVGGQDELVYDGGSMIVAPGGTVVARAPQFTETLLVSDLDLAALGAGVTGPVEAADGTRMTVELVTVGDEELESWDAVPSPLAPMLTDTEEVYAALVTGTRDYVRKNGFRSVVMGLSGGIDSALVATIAVDALGAAAVHVIGMPSRYSSEHSLADARDLAERQGIAFDVVPIEPIVLSFLSSLEDSGGLHGLSAENLQARVRGTTLMALSNEHGHLVLTTGNKSELATGYSTLYGDSAGGFAPIKDVPKTLVWELARWRNAAAAARGEKPPIPENSITKPPSAELRDGQLDSDSLPDYDVLDRLLDDYIERDLGHDELIAAGHEALLVERVIRLVDSAEYKRRQYPPGPKISLKAFGRDRRLPITNRWREVAAPHVLEPETARPDSA
jgi:NAD+ synthase (glutamine-hydrolysing)